MKKVIIQLLPVFLFMSVITFSCKKNTDIKYETDRPDIQADEKFMDYLTSLPSIEMKSDEVVLPNHLTIKAFTAPRRTTSVNGPQQLKNTMITNVITKGFELSATNFDWPALPTEHGKVYPAQNKIGYSLGSKQYAERTKDMAPNCNLYIHALDCSGLVSLCFKNGGITNFPDGTANQCNATSIQNAIRNLGPDYQKFKVAVVPLASVNDLRSGDIVIFYNADGAPKHDGVYVKDVNGTTGLIQSNGNNVSAQDCQKNAGPNRGPRILPMSTLLSSDFFSPTNGWTWKVVRITVDISGKWDYYFRCAGQSSDAFHLVLDFTSADNFQMPLSFNDYNGTPITGVFDFTYDRVANILSGTCSFDLSPFRQDSFTIELNEDDTGYFPLTKTVDNGGCYAEARMVIIL